MAHKVYKKALNIDYRLFVKAGVDDPTEEQVRKELVQHLLGMKVKSSGCNWYLEMGCPEYNAPSIKVHKIRKRQYYP